MYIDEIKATIRLETTEINDIAYAIEVQMRKEVESHYTNHPLRVFQEQAGGKQRLLETFYGLIGQPHRASGIIKELVGEIEKAAKEREKT